MVQRARTTLPRGTQVVMLRDVTALNHQGGWTKLVRGRVGTVLEANDVSIGGEQTYRLLFDDKDKVGCLDVPGDALQVRKWVPDEAMERTLTTFGHYRNGELDDQDEQNVWDYRVVYEAETGSRAYLLDGPGSDRDIRGVFVPAAEEHWSLRPVPKLVERAGESDDGAYWEIEHFIRLALKANPNVLEVLYSPSVIRLDHDLFGRILDNRQRFLSRFLYQTYQGYVLGQMKKIEADLRNHGEVRWKHAMHLLRLLRSGTEALHENDIRIGITDESWREFLLEVKQGNVEWEVVHTQYEVERQRFDFAFEKTSLPDYPDFDWANQELVRIRKLATVL